MKYNRGTEPIMKTARARHSASGAPRGGGICNMISIASDHGGYRLKEHIKAYLTAKGINLSLIHISEPTRP